jgi:hypothetical protein
MGAMTLARQNSQVTVSLAVLVQPRLAHSMGLRGGGLQNQVAGRKVWRRQKKSDLSQTLPLDSLAVVLGRRGEIAEGLAPIWCCCSRR